MKTKHTPTPWEHNYHGRIFSNNILVCDTMVSSEIPFGPENLANADFIERAVNSHEVLLGALKEIVEDIPRINRKQYYAVLIAQAEGE